MKDKLNDYWPVILAAIIALILGTTIKCEAQVNNKHNLNDKAYYVMVNSGTESRFSSVLNSEKRDGVYLSAATGDTLFLSSSKFDSGTGWPSFDSATNNVALGPREQGGYEVIEKSTGYHLGHLFTGEKFTSKNKRYCINGDALEFLTIN